jgi:palmitoyltransferase
MNHELADANTLMLYSVTVKNTRFINSLLDQGANVNFQDHLGRAPLHIAYKHGQIENAVHLIQRGASLQIRDSAGRVPPDYDSSLL